MGIYNIYIYMYRMSYVPMVFVGKCHVYTDIEKDFFYKSWIELRFASTLLSSQSYQPVLGQTLPPIPIQLKRKGSGSVETSLAETFWSEPSTKLPRALSTGVVEASLMLDGSQKSRELLVERCPWDGNLVGGFNPVEK